jgi:hypothetical protein
MLNTTNGCSWEPTFDGCSTKGRIFDKLNTKGELEFSVSYLELLQ